MINSRVEGANFTCKKTQFFHCVSLFLLLLLLFKCWHGQLMSVEEVCMVQSLRLEISEITQSLRLCKIAKEAHNCMEVPPIVERQ